MLKKSIPLAQYLQVISRLLLIAKVCSLYKENYYKIFLISFRIKKHTLH